MYDFSVCSVSFINGYIFHYTMWTFLHLHGAYCRQVKRWTKKKICRSYFASDFGFVVYFFLSFSIFTKFYYFFYLCRYESVEYSLDCKMIIVKLVVNILSRKINVTWNESQKKKHTTMMTIKEQKKKEEEKNGTNSDWRRNNLLIA